MTYLVTCWARFIHNLHAVPFRRHSVLVLLLRLKEDGDAEPEFGVTIDQLIAAVADIGNNYEGETDGKRLY